MTMLVLVNAKSGTVRDRGQEALRAEIEDALAERGSSGNVRFIRPERLEEEIRQAIKSKPALEKIVVGGGDGSLSLAASLLAGKDIALGVLPLGTMNLFARALGVPLGVGEAIAAQADAEAVKIDLLEINGRSVLFHASLGLQPKVIQAREKLPYKTRLMRLTNGILAWVRATRTVRPVRITGFTSEGRFERNASAALISNNVLPEGIGETPVAHDLSGGKIAVYICTSSRRSDLVALTLATSLGIWRQSDLVEEFISDKLDIASDRPSLLLSLDGELARFETPLKCRLRRRCLTVLMPRQEGTDRGDSNRQEAVL